MEVLYYMYSNKAPLHMHARILVLLFMVVPLSGCLATAGDIRNYRNCGMRDYCPERDGPRQYIRAPDGWGGKYCLNNPMEC